MSRFAPRLRELRIHLCQTGETSKGVRDFIKQHYVKIKQANPTLPILIRECSGVEPKVWARYEKGVEECAPLINLTPGEVLSKIESLAK